MRRPRESGCGLCSSRLQSWQGVESTETSQGAAGGNCPTPSPVGQSHSGGSSTGTGPSGQGRTPGAPTSHKHSKGRARHRVVSVDCSSSHCHVSCYYCWEAYPCSTSRVCPVRLRPECWGLTQDSKAQTWGHRIHLSDTQEEVRGDSYPAWSPSGWGGLRERGPAQRVYPWPSGGPTATSGRTP